MPIPMSPQMPGAGGPPTPEVPKDPLQSSGEELITQLLQMAAGNPQMLMGLALAGAAREVSQLTGLTRRRQGGTSGKGGAMPPAAALLAGNRGDVDQLMALQQLMAGGQQGPPGMPPGGSPLAQLGGQVAPMGMGPGMAPPTGMPLGMGMPAGPMGPVAPQAGPVPPPAQGGLPPWLAGLV